AQHGSRGELDFATGRLDPEELAVVGAAPTLVRGDEVALGEDQLDLVAQVGEGGEEVIDGLALPVPPPRLAVVDEAPAEQALAGAGTALVDRPGVEAANEVLVGFERHRARPYSNDRRASG